MKCLIPTWSVASETMPRLPAHMLIDYSIIYMTNSYIKPEFELIELIPGSALLQTSGNLDSVATIEPVETEEGGELL